MGAFTVWCLLMMMMMALMLSSTKGAEIGVYWGQNGNEGSLSDACATGNYQIVIIAFLSAFGGGTKPLLNLASHCDPSNGGCAVLSPNITACQSRGVKVLLSIGGGAGNYSLSTANDTAGVAEYLWNSFLGGKSDSRPLGNAVLDGIDFTIETGEQQSWEDLAKALRGYGGNFSLSAAPQCPFPDSALDAAISSGVFDYVWIQFYNNPSCQFSQGSAEKLIAGWNRWTSVRTNKIFLGLPAAEEASPGGGFVPDNLLVSEVLPAIQSSPKYGGIMLWNRFYDTSYSSSIINSLNQTQPGKNTNQTELGGTSQKGGGSNLRLKIAIVLGVSGSTVLFMCLTCIFYHKLILGFIFRRETEEDRKLESLVKQYGSLAPKRYSFSDIKKITKSFKDELGRGGYGSVYKGKLFDDRLVAVKILDSTKGNGEEFINEVLSIGRTSHVNIVMLQGFCLERKRRALVYEYMPNGSLEKYIHGNKNGTSTDLGMDKLYQISLGVARGLEYLHRGCNTRILHFDIKPHNILLDEDFTPKISDFGLAKQYAKKKESEVSSILGPRGTIGYIAPELVSRSFGGVSHKSDVYSYGMMILEIVGRRKNVHLETSHTSEVFFPHWAYQHLVIDKDLSLKGVASPEEDEIAKKIIIVGLWCIQHDPSQRPAMGKVIEMLEGELQAIPMPPKAFFGFPSTTPQPSSSTTYYSGVNVS